MSILGFRPHEREIKEGAVQTAVVGYARVKYPGKIIAIKRSAGKFGSNGWPDYEFLIKRGYCFHIEFKKPGGVCTELQLRRHAELRALGHRVYVCDNAVAGRAIIDTEMLCAKRRLGREVHTA